MINVRQIALRNCYSHASSDVELPSRGVVVVQGDNGAGKSGLFLEGVAVALWGKTLRGTPGWGPEEAAGGAMAAVALPGLRVERVRASGKTSLFWTTYDDATDEGRAVDALVRLGGLPEAATYETTTKAQDALEVLVGTFDVWRRTSAFSASDAAHFSLATDAERKRLLESVLGLDRFDRALEACRADSKAREMDMRLAETSLYGAEVASAKADEAVGAARDRLAALAAEAPPEPTPPAGRPLAELEAIATQLATALRAAELQVERAAAAGSVSRAEAERHAALVARLERATTCPACRQGISPAYVAAMRQEAEAAAAQARAERVAAAQARAWADAELTELRENFEAVRARVAQRRRDEETYAHRRAERDRFARVRAQLVGGLEAAENACREASAALDAARAKAGHAAAELATLRAVEQVLGLRGVRAQLLGRALGGIEAMANAWLVRLGLHGLAVHLRPSRTKKDGDRVDAIEIEVVGAGAGYGYRAASAGERRRIDVALLLGLGEVAAAAHGRPPGTLFFDEVFETLDEDGVSAVSAALEELAQTRCVVVVTHNAALASALPAVRRFYISRGEVAGGAQARSKELADEEETDG